MMQDPPLELRRLITKIESELTDTVREELDRDDVRVEFDVSPR